MTPRLRVVVLFACSIVAAIGLGWLFGLPELSALAVAGAAVAALCGAHLAWGPSLPGTDASVSPRSVGRGDPAHLELHLSNPTGSRSRPVRIAGGFGPAGKGSVAIGGIEPQRSTALAIEIPTERRGVFGFGPLELRSADPLRMWNRVTSRPIAAILVVQPLVHPLPGLFGQGPDRIGSGRPTAAMHRGPDAEVDLAGLRPYVPGDDLRRIHWRTSARRNQPHVVQVEPPLGPAEVVVLVDTRTAACGPQRFEYAVEASASICAAAIRSGRPVHLTTTAGTGADHPATPEGLAQALEDLARVGQHPVGDPRTRLRRIGAGAHSMFVCTGDPAVADDPEVTTGAAVVCWDGSVPLAELIAGPGSAAKPGAARGVVEDAEPLHP